MAMGDTMSQHTNALGMININTNSKPSPNIHAYNSVNGIATDAVIAAFASPQLQQQEQQQSEQLPMQPQVDYGEGGLAQAVTGGGNYHDIDNYNLDEQNLNPGQVYSDVPGNENQNKNENEATEDINIDDLNVTQAQSGESAVEANGQMFKNELNEAVVAEDAFMDEIVGHMETSGR